jgi:hypothetical protein
LSPFENGLPANDPMLKMALERLKQLAAHEVGHTLGLMHNYASSVNDRASVMDYPHPLVRLNGNGEISLNNAYDQKIGEWDKVAITWGYQDFSAGTNETEALNKILTEASKKGLQFISDRDARAPGGAHPQAHLWDNGKDAVSELMEVNKVRAVALKKFGMNSIRTGTPMAFLEDVLVPVYFYHRYQVEAVTKLIGGQNYSYSLKGDGQVQPTTVPKKVQEQALQAILSCLQPSFLELPDNLSKLIPPRPAGYEFNRELFKKRTGLVFDLLAPAETAADLPLSFLFNSERVSRMVQQETTGGLGLGQMIQLLVDNTWKAKRLTGMQQLIQQQTEQVLLTYLLALSVDDNAGFAAEAEGVVALKKLTSFIDQQLKTVSLTTSYRSHLELALERMKAPEKAKPTLHAAIPPGAPIGCEE